MKQIGEQCAIVNHRLSKLFDTHVFAFPANRNIVRNERLTTEQKVPVGYFTVHNDKWVLVNQKLTTLKDVTEGKDIPIGTMVELTDGKKLLLSAEEGGRLVTITMANK